MRPLRIITAALLLAGTVTAGLALRPRPAHADEALAELLGSVVGRFIVGETSEGLALSSRLGTTDAHELASKLDSPELAETRARVKDALEHARALVDAEGARPSDGALSEVEELVLRRLARGELGSIKFVAEAPKAGSYASTRERFLAPEGETTGTDGIDPAESGGDPAPTPEELRAGKSRLRRWVEGMKACVKNRPPSAERKSQLSYMLTNIGISEAMTAGGYVVGVGLKKVSIKDLSSELLMTLFSTAVGNKLTVGTSSALVRWVKVAAWGVARAGIDATYYYVTPLKDEHGGTVGSETEDRLEYDIAWNTATSPIYIGLYALTSGVECLSPGGMTRAATAGLRMATFAGTSVTYYHLRKALINQ
jgi:hypothetical protein